MPDELEVPDPATPDATDVPEATATATPEAPAAEPELGGDDPQPEPELGAEAEGDGEAGDREPELGDEPEDGEPIEYDFTPPEGADPYREPVIDAYKAAAQKIKLPADQAKQLLEEMTPVFRKDLVDQVNEANAATMKQFRAKLDERHGDRVPDVIRSANRALARAGTPELRKLIASSPLKNHPDFIDLLAHYGQREKSDSPPGRNNGAPTSAEPLSAEQEAALEYAEAAKKNVVKE